MVMARHHERGSWRGKALAILQISRRFAASICVLESLLCWPGAGLAGPAIPAPVTAPRSAPSAALPSNNASCVYDQMSFEDREIALLLFEREVASSAKLFAGSRNIRVISRLINEARDKCAAPYAWSRGRSDAAIGYAMNELMSSGLAQALEAKGHPAALIDAYYTKHRAELAGTETIAGPRLEAFQAYLIEQGWPKSEAPLLGIGEYYLQALLTRERQARIFGATAARPATAVKIKPSRPPLRAKSARRGKP